MSAAALIEQNFEATVLKNKVDSMKEELSLFCKTLDPDHFKNAIVMRDELNE